MNDIFAVEEAKLRAEKDARQEPPELALKADEELLTPPQPSLTIPIPPQPAHISKSFRSTIVAPQRDFNRRANSIERVALPSGMFPGSSKKIYDAIYARTRGAVQPRLEMQATKRELMLWSGIRNNKTIETHTRYLVTAGLLTRRGENGDSAGYFYGVALPENLQPPPSLAIPSHLQPSPTIPPPNQKTVVEGDQKSVLVGEGQIVENIRDRSSAKTSLKTNTDDDETHTLDELTKVIIEAAREVVGGELKTSAQERERWKEVGQLIADELRTASLRAETISSVPAFLAAHLRRQLAKKPRALIESVKNSESGSDSRQPSISKGNNNKARKNKSASHNAIDEIVKSNFTLEECRRYAEHLHATGQGITNPGGFAISIHRSGVADTFIEQFLHPTEKAKSLDISACPDCKGTGFWYPQGFGQPVAKCKHKQLLTPDNTAQSQKQRLTTEEVVERANLIAELLKNGYTLEQAEAQFGESFQAEDWIEIKERAASQLAQQSREASSDED
jgi:hypothetical protein